MKKILLTIYLCLIFCHSWKTFGQVADSTNITVQDSVITDTLAIDSTKKQSDFDAPVNYQAQDSIIFMIQNKTSYFYNQVKIEYQDMNLSAGFVLIDWAKNLIIAKGIKDTSDSLVQTPVFKDNKDTYYAEKIKYNFITKKGIIFLAKTKQNEDIIFGEAVKRNPDKTFYIKNGYFTTCDANPPHYIIKSKKLKVIPGKKVISGPLLMEISGVPIPLILPFGYFPQSKGRTSGFVFPTFGEAAQRGFFARNFGYYYGKSDYYDLFINADIFSKGGWRIGTVSRYKKRYKLSGNIDVNYSLQKYNEKTDPDYQENRSFFVRWNHNQTITPNDKFTANVNAGSSNFLRFNSYQTTDYLRTQLQSSITYQKRFVRSPWNLTAGATHTQQLQTRDVTINFPNIFLARSRLFPLKKLGKKTNTWYQKIGISYSSNFINRVSVKDSNLFLPTTFSDSMKYGIKQQSSVSTNIKLLNYLTLTPSFNYLELWYPWEIEKQFVFRDSVYVLETKRIKKFTPVRQFNTGASLSTQLYGIFQRSRKWALRHTLNPSISYNYKPDFSKSNWNFYKEVVNPTTGEKIKYSKTEDGIFGSPSAGEINAISLAINNRYETKIMKKIYARGDSAMPSNVKEAYNYYTLFDNIGIFSSYNFAADSLNLSPVRLNARTMLVNTLNLNADFTLNPYAIDSTGKVINKFYWNTNKKIGRWTQINFTAGASVRNLGELLKGKQDKNKNSPYEEFDWKWDFSFNYVFTYSRPAFEIYRTQSLRFSGTFSPTRNWRLSFNSGYDFTTEQLSFTTFTLHRDLHCWEMDMTIIPFGLRKSYYLTLRVKAASLRDLKITKRRDWQDRITGF